jgi:hypothetical protein
MPCDVRPLGDHKNVYGYAPPFTFIKILPVPELHASFMTYADADNDALTEVLEKNMNSIIKMSFFMRMLIL